ncbi:hypothetical protein TcBrA4_0023730 [Trypanosoma cruzi]|nr:hypothetical protein TcBrA4_0023730 [Trypanosoma cruzi]
MRSCLVGCVHTALHHGGEAVAPCPAPTHLHGLGVRHGDSRTASLGPRAANKDASVHLEASPAPLRRIIGFRALTQHERLTRLRYIEEVRGAAPLGNHGIVNTLEGGDDYFSAGGCVLDGLRRVRHHMLSTALLPGTLRAAAGWAYSSHGTPGTPWTVSDDRPLKRRTPLRDRVSGSSALPLDSPDSGALCGPHRAASGSLACSCRAECPATEHGHRRFPVPRLAAASQSPTRVPVARDSLSAMEALCLYPLAAHDDFTDEICTVPLSLAD